MEPILYLEYPVRLQFLFSPVEIHLLMCLELFEKKKEQGEWVPLGKEAYLEATGLTEYSFDACVRRIINIGLVNKVNNRKGNRVYYNFRSDQYERLKDILERFSSDESARLFCFEYFIKDRRQISDITNLQIRKHNS